MPNSTRVQKARLRRKLTGEPTSSARSGIGRNNEIFDRMTLEQQAFRAHLALHLFNSADDSANRLWYYTIVSSPQYDELVWFADAPSNVANTVLCMDVDWRTIEVEENPPSVLFTDALTGGRLRVRHLLNPDFGHVTLYADRTREDRFRCEAVCRQHRVHPANPDAQILLGALVSRYQVGLVSGLDELSLSHMSSAQRPVGRDRIELQGTWADWSLDWDGRPWPEAWVHALTDDVIGLTGATATWIGDRATVHFRTAQLHLQPTGTRKSPW